MPIDDGCIAAYHLMLAAWSLRAGNLLDRRARSGGREGRSSGFRRSASDHGDAARVARGAAGSAAAEGGAGAGGLIAGGLITGGLGTGGLTVRAVQ